MRVQGNEVLLFIPCLLCSQDASLSVLHRMIVLEKVRGISRAFVNHYWSYVDAVIDRLMKIKV